MGGVFVVNMRPYESQGLSKLVNYKAADGTLYCNSQDFVKQCAASYMSYLLMPGFLALKLTHMLLPVNTDLEGPIGLILHPPPCVANGYV